MRRHAAQIENGVVVRVIVADPEWAAARLGGEWVETDKTGATGIVYCGPGFGCDLNFPERFAPQWVAPTPDPQTGVWSSYHKGDLRYHDGQLWRSTCDNNVWPPGVSGWWPESDIEGVVSIWIQPTGAHDAFNIGDQRVHDNPNDGGNIWIYQSAINANTTEPGRDGVYNRWWTPISLYAEVDPVPEPEPEPEPEPSWIDTGVTIAQLIGAGVYRVSGVTAITFGQAIRLGETSAGETVFNGYWPTAGTASDYIKITPHKSAAVGSKVYKWE